jgi:hypothetical protein
VEFKNEILGQVSFVTPDNPTDANICEPKFVAAGVDGYDAGKFEVPFELRLDTRYSKSIDP